MDQGDLDPRQDEDEISQQSVQEAAAIKQNLLRAARDAFKKSHCTDRWRWNNLPGGHFDWPSPGAIFITGDV
jgi:hypothetical protein